MSAVCSTKYRVSTIAMNLLQLWGFWMLERSVALAMRPNNTFSLRLLLKREDVGMYIVQHMN
jgi:hypothetical protein